MNLGQMALSLPVPPDVPACLDWARRAEDLGYESIWIAETGGPDPFVLAGTVAQVTRRARIGLAVSPVYIRTPATIAAASGTVAQLAPGRFILGLGASSHAIVENWHGVPFRKPLTRVRETVSFLRQAFAGEKAASALFGVRGFRYARGFAPPPPIFIAALQERMLALAGSMGDGVIINWLAPGDVPKVVRVAKDAARDAGRDADALEVVARIFVIPTTNDALVRVIARRAIAGYLTTPVYSAFHRWLGRGEALRPMQEAWDAGDRQSATELVPDTVIDDLFVTGDRQACLDKIEAYCRAGVTVPVLNLMPTALDPKELGQRNVAAMRELAPR